MARKFLTAVDFAKNEIQNAVVQVLASAPSTPSPGQIYYNSTSGRIEFRNARLGLMQQLERIIQGLN